MVKLFRNLDLEEIYHEGMKFLSEQANMAQDINSILNSSNIDSLKLKFYIDALAIFLYTNYAGKEDSLDFKILMNKIFQAESLDKLKSILASDLWWKVSAELVKSDKIGLYGYYVLATQLDLAVSGNKHLYEDILYEKSIGINKETEIYQALSDILSKSSEDQILEIEGAPYSGSTSSHVSAIKIKHIPDHIVISYFDSNNNKLIKATLKAPFNDYMKNNLVILKEMVVKCAVGIRYLGTTYNCKLKLYKLKHYKVVDHKILTKAPLLIRILLKK